MKENPSPLQGAGQAPSEPDYEIEAHSSFAALPPKVLKDGDTFAVLDLEANCGKGASSVEGIYFRDMRVISRWILTIGKLSPLVLSSSVHDDNSALTVTLSNPDMQSQGLRLEKDVLAITRTKFLLEGACYERIALKNFDRAPHAFHLQLSFDADFLDLFEVRGMERAARGAVARRTEAGTILIHYAGLDDVARQTRIAFEPAPASLTPTRATFNLALAAGETANIIVRAQFFELGSKTSRLPSSFLFAYRKKRRETRAKAVKIAAVKSSNDVFNDMIGRSAGDIAMLLSEGPAGVYPHAGIPWYSTVFGRDGIITAFLMLWADPSIARGVLLYLASRQATEHDAARDAQPGKILHEERSCETARTGEVPFAGYYGTVDATPLFVVLAGHYFRRTGDARTLVDIWPNIKAAVAWCDIYGDRDGDGFVEYFRETPNGLANQGWKDSYDSIFHADGTLAEGPIALVEVQAYVYEAKLQAAKLAAHFGEQHLSERWRADAAALKKNFNETFWSDRLGTYAIALDGAKRPCETSSSNAGHVLLTDLPSPGRAARVAEKLLEPDIFSGWGVRTVSANAARYNPMSYHNGSVWPHDNALIGVGLARHGLKDHLKRVFEGLYAAHAYQQDRRLPELFCGFPRKRGRAPVGYPVSCSPQAWAAATPFGLLAACLGLDIDHEANVVQFNNPVLPDFLDGVTLTRLQISEASMDVKLTRTRDDVGMTVLGRTGDVHAIIYK